MSGIFLNHFPCVSIFLIFKRFVYFKSMSVSPSCLHFHQGRVCHPQRSGVGSPGLEWGWLWVTMWELGTKWVFWRESTNCWEKSHHPFCNVFWVRVPHWPISHECWLGCLTKEPGWRSISFCKPHTLFRARVTTPLCLVFLWLLLIQNEWFILTQ